jgi:hypothetical protein
MYLPNMPVAAALELNRDASDAIQAPPAGQQQSFV